MLYAQAVYSVVKVSHTASVMWWHFSWYHYFKLQLWQVMDRVTAVHLLVGTLLYEMCLWSLYSPTFCIPGTACHVATCWFHCVKLYLLISWFFWPQYSDTRVTSTCTMQRDWKNVSFHSCFHISYTIMEVYGTTGSHTECFPKSHLVKRTTFQKSTTYHQLLTLWTLCCSVHYMKLTAATFIRWSFHPAVSVWWR